VQNIDDGIVYVLAQGTKNSLDKLLQKCYSGPRYAKVNNVNVVRLEVDKKYTSFKVKF
jgi:acylphosphatase